MITEYLMKPGRFSVRLKDSTPFEVRQQIADFDQIVVTPAPIDPAESLADGAMLAVALYSGVIQGRADNDFTLTGYGLGWYLGTEDGRGAIYETAVTNTATDLPGWFTDLLPASIVAGTITDTGTNLTYTFQYVTPREAITYACRAMGAEWRINPDGTIDADTAANLFASGEVVITRHPQGSNSDHKGVETDQVTTARDAEGYTTKVIVVGKNGDGAQVALGDATGADVYLDFHGNPVVLKRLANAPTTPAASVDDYAAALLDLFPTTRRSVRLSSRSYAIPMTVRPGDSVYVWDVDAGMYDTANQINWNGQAITPVLVRCLGYSWPLMSKMGVYVRRDGAYVDISDHVEFEDGQPTTWEVGTSLADPDQDPSQLSPAFLGVNADVAARTVVPPATTWTPTVTNLTVGNGAWSATTYTIGRDGFCDFQGRFVLGTTSAVTGRLIVTLPFTCAHNVRPGQFAAGVYDDNAGATHPFYCSAVGNATQFALDAVATGGTYAVAAASSATSPITFTNPDAIEFSGRFRLA